MGVVDLNVVEGVGVFLFWEVETVGSLLPDHQHEGLALSRLLLAAHPRDRHVCDDVGVVARDHATVFAVEVELGVEVFALAFVGDEIVEARPGLVALLTHVPLADIRGLVAGLLQPPGKTVEVERIVGEVVGHAVGVGVEPAENRGPAR